MRAEAEVSKRDQDLTVARTRLAVAAIVDEKRAHPAVSTTRYSRGRAGRAYRHDRRPYSPLGADNQPVQTLIPESASTIAPKLSGIGC